MGNAFITICYRNRLGQMDGQEPEPDANREGLRTGSLGGFNWVGAEAAVKEFGLRDVGLGSGRNLLRANNPPVR